MSVRLTCPRCHAALVPTWSGLRCPRMSACGYGGHVESVAHPLPFAIDVNASTGVRA